MLKTLLNAIQTIAPTKRRKGRRRTAARLSRLEQLESRMLLTADLSVEFAVIAPDAFDVPAEIGEAGAGVGEASIDAPVGAEVTPKKTPSPTGVAGSGATGESSTTTVYPDGGKDDIVSIFDKDDGTRPDGIADSDDFEEAADDYHEIGASDWQQAVQKLEEYVEHNGLIDVLYIFDHGTTYVDSTGAETGHTQEFGDAALTPEMLDDIKHLLADDAVIVLAGCSVADDPDYVQDLADAVDATVIASDALVQYDPEWFNDDFQSQGDWQVFTPTGEDSSVSPTDIGLDTVDVETAEKPKK